MFGMIFGYTSDACGILGAVIMVAQGVRFMRQKQRYEQKIHSLEELRHESTNYVINMSGHPLTQDSPSVGDWLKDKTIVPLHPDVNNRKTIQEIDEFVKEADRLISEIPRDLFGKIQRASAVTFALPGMSILTQILLVKLHAIQGVFPMVTISLRNPDTGEFVWHEPIDLQHVRTKHWGATDALP